MFLSITQNRGAVRRHGCFETDEGAGLARSFRFRASAITKWRSGTNFPPQW
jgi:hypothetical protein